ncbi:UNVERIFIED_CONTAM: hypothetical protein RMT77_007430 [Armadillidium vulgare]
MNTPEDEEGQVNFVSEVSLSPKRSVGKVCNNTNIIPKDNGESTEQCDINDSPNREFQTLIKSNSVVTVGNRSLTAKYNNHNSDHRDCETTLKPVITDGECVKQEENNKDSNEKDCNDSKIKSIRIVLTQEQLDSLSKEELIEKWNQQDLYIESLLLALDNKIQEVNEFKQNNVNEERLKSQLSEIQRKEQYHIMRLATKEHEIQELGAQIEELKNLTAGGNSLKHSLLDPAINLLFERMKRDFDTTKAKMEEAQNELAAWKFTPDSNTGKQLMAKCRLLIKENEELGKMISSGRLSKLEGDLALQRNFGDELKKSQSELEEFLQEMDEDTEGMQGTILYLQSQLRKAKDTISLLTSQLSLLGQTTSNNTPASVVGEGADYVEGSFSETEPDEGRTLYENSEHSTKYLYKENNDDDESTLLLTASNNNNSSSSSNRRLNGGEIMANITCNNSNNNNNNSSSCISGLTDALHNNNNTQLLTTVKNFASRRNSNGSNTNKRTCSSVLQDEEEEEEGERQENSSQAESAGNADGQTNDQYSHASPPSPLLQHVSKRARMEKGTGASEEGVIAAEHVVENGLTMK